MGKRNRQHAGGRLLNLPDDIFKTGIGLIDQQMWCWGCDVRRAEGNLLTQYGFIKRPAPEPRYHSAYTLYEAIPDGALTLWGWGLWIAAPERGSLFIGRDRFHVRWIPETDLAPSAWLERDLPSGCADTRFSDAYLLLHAAFLWIAAYEHWVVEVHEQSYRARTIEAYPQRRRFKGGVLAERMSAQWLELANVTFAAVVNAEAQSEHTYS
ncbi:MAG: hypothetical protein IPK17_20500 [Chloroflexi bacterium]|uniref:hypothetical protein n=1 Tax=Candidatus Flexifilum breve TaxID=3140694 RepID=UPI0031366CCD|nr:hypothetical protein [Chloroflexota bacterium]